MADEVGRRLRLELHPAAMRAVLRNRLGQRMPCLYVRNLMNRGQQGIGRHGIDGDAPAMRIPLSISIEG